MAGRTLQLNQIIVTDSKNKQLYPTNKSCCHTAHIRITGSRVSVRKIKKVVDEDGILKSGFRFPVQQELSPELALNIDLKAERKFFCDRSFGKIRIKYQDLLDWYETQQQGDLQIERKIEMNKGKRICKISYGFNIPSTSAPSPLQAETGGVGMISRLKGFFSLIGSLFDRNPDAIYKHVEFPKSTE